ncbi:hypothetical protein Bca4012_065418 [Brassica carinata]|uniref:Aldehyde dehydrogenase domain-containing protein n=1 Tax=Brassica carinata TaxID=52824 RepID=A0A8X7VNN6_BRACI|nr:hypothetical protein Bca52824_017758 [Brassica carinata]
MRGVGVGLLKGKSDEVRDCGEIDDIGAASAVPGSRRHGTIEAAQAQLKRSVEYGTTMKEKLLQWKKIVRIFGTSSGAEKIISLLVQVSYTQLLIDGNFVDSASGKTFLTLDPHTGKVIVNKAEGDGEDINQAVKAARKAIDERSRIMQRFTYLVEKHSEELAALETWDNGKTYEQAKTAQMASLECHHP